MAAKSRWDLSGWTGGPVTLFEAFGIKKGTVQYPKLLPQITAAQLSGIQQKANVSGNAGSAAAQAAANAVGGPATANEAANKKLGQSLAQAYGWGTGQQWTALNNLVMSESGWNNTAQNPTSTAYGIGQFLDSTWASVGGQKTSNPTAQINYMLAYILGKYGTPVAAWNFHLANNWY